MKAILALQVFLPLFVCNPVPKLGGPRSTKQDYTKKDGRRRYDVQTSTLCQGCYGKTGKTAVLPGFAE